MIYYAFAILGMELFHDVIKFNVTDRYACLCVYVMKTRYEVTSVSSKPSFTGIKNGSSKRRVESPVRNAVNISVCEHLNVSVYDYLIYFFI